VDCRWVCSVVHTIESSSSSGAFPKWQMYEVVRYDGPTHAVTHRRNFFT
jgi:hypothetical protein